MVDWAWAAMEVMVGMQARQSQVGLAHVGRNRSPSRVHGGDNDDTGSHRLTFAPL